MEIKETVKKLFGKVLNVGTPPEKEVLYKEIIKRKIPEESPEKVFIENVKQSFKKVFTTKKETIENTDVRNSDIKKVSKKKTSPKKVTTKKTTVKSSTKKLPSTKNTTKKTVAKKTVAKKPIVKKLIVKKIADPKTKKKTPTTQKLTNKKTVTEKKATTKKPVLKAKSSKRDEKIALYIKDVKKHYTEVDEAFLAIIVKNLGPSIYRKDAELVSCSDSKELDTVRRNFLIKKLGIDASKSVLDAAIQDVCTELKGVRTKYRATFYYALAKKFKKESELS